MHFYSTVTSFAFEEFSTDVEDYSFSGDSR